MSDIPVDIEVDVVSEELDCTDDPEVAVVTQIEPASQQQPTAGRRGNSKQAQPQVVDKLPRKRACTSNVWEHATKFDLNGELFEDYSRVETPSAASESSNSAQSTSHRLMDMDQGDMGFNAMAFFMQHQKASGQEARKSELEIYLQEEPEKNADTTAVVSDLPHLVDIGLSILLHCLDLCQAAPNLAAIAKGRAAAANIFSMIGTSMIETDSKKPSRQADGEAVLPEVAGDIEFCEVCFAYPSWPNMVFENLSFSIVAGKTFAFVGPSGSGKSTIISLVQRFYEPTFGRILLDGHDLKNLQLKWLTEQIGLVSQEPALFDTTIAGNILLGKEDADMEQVILAAKAANAHSFIEELPDRYNTQHIDSPDNNPEANKEKHNVYVSTGDWAEHVLRKGPSAVKYYVEKFKQMGFDTIELNVTSLEVPEETPLRYVRLIKSGGLKAKNLLGENERTSLHTPILL
ncbi:ABC transporter-like protein [Corchorus olitorius]|uniref:ABC transporter-like protein n=1 Tax=Corchorus olitorius TaxID=93759 RepID=A0A1R3K322_9ROSI|nr:ABC transporter-like protein [Corchorus olitorius]